MPAPFHGVKGVRLRPHHCRRALASALKGFPFRCKRVFIFWLAAARSPLAASSFSRRTALPLFSLRPRRRRLSSSPFTPSDGFSVSLDVSLRLPPLPASMALRLLCPPSPSRRLSLSSPHLPVSDSLLLAVSASLLHSHSRAVCRRVSVLSPPPSPSDFLALSRNLSPSL